MVAAVNVTSASPEANDVTGSRPIPAALVVIEATSGPSTCVSELVAKSWTENGRP
jgi:hypothetical protein